MKNLKIKITMLIFACMLFMFCSVYGQDFDSSSNFSSTGTIHWKDVTQSSSAGSSNSQKVYTKTKSTSGSSQSVSNYAQQQIINTMFSSFFSGFMQGMQQNNPSRQDQILKQQQEEAARRQAEEAKRQAALQKNKEWLDSLNFMGEGGVDIGGNTTPKLLRSGNENDEFSSLEKALNNIEQAPNLIDVQAKIQERISAIQLDIERIQTGLKGLTKSLLSNKEEFDKWHDEIDDSFKTALKSCFEYPADILPGRVDDLVKAKIASNNEIKTKLISFVGSAKSEKEIKQIYNVVKAIDERNMKLEHFNSLSSLLASSKATSDVDDLDKNNDEYKKYLDGVVMYGDIVAGNAYLGSAKVIATSYSDIARECVGWYKINQLNYGNDKYMDAVSDLNDRMKVKVAELKYFKGCLANPDSSAQSKCFSAYKTPKVIVPPLRKTR